MRCPRGHKIKPLPTVNPPSSSNMVAVKTPSLAETYRALCSVLKQQPAYQVMVVNHIAAKHGIHSLPAFQLSEAIGEQDKLVTYGEVVRVLTGKAAAATLQGQVAAGQAAAAPEAEPHGTNGSTPPPPPAPNAEEEETQAQARLLQSGRGAILPVTRGTTEGPAPEKDGTRTSLPSESAPTPPTTDSADPALDQLREALRKVIGPQEAKLDEARVRQLVDERAATLSADALKVINQALADAKAATAQAIADALAAVKPTAVTHEFKLGAEVRPVTGAIHRQLPQVVAWVRSGVPVWLWGQAGGGKTHLARQLAEALGLPFYCAPIDETITVGKLVGFRNVSNGEFVEGLMYRAYKYGGVQLLDEIDTNATAIASTNSLTANDHYTFPNGEEVPRHPDFRLIAGANSKGTGAVAGYTARVRMDAATLDRFAVIKLEYDPGLELALAAGVPSTATPWAPGEPASPALCRAYVEWVQRARSKVGDSVLISPRASYLGVRALSAGIPPAEVADALVFKLVTDDTRRRILSEAGEVPTAA